jgi:hypothetical protein
MKTHTRYAAAALVCSAAAVTPALLITTGGQAQQPAGQTLVLKNSALKVTPIDLPPLVRSKRSPETAGDELIASSKVSGGGASGTRYLMCAVAKRGGSVEHALYSCQITYNLTAGTITAATVARVGGSRPVTAAITGGTGAYAGASGTVSSAAGTDTLTIG